MIKTKEKSRQSILRKYEGEEIIFSWGGVDLFLGRVRVKGRPLRVGNIYQGLERREGIQKN